MPVKRLNIQVFLRPGPVAISVLVHIIVFGAVFTTWKATPEPKIVKPPRYIEAKLVKLKTEAKVAPKKVQPKKVDLTKKKKAEPPKKTQPTKKTSDDIQKAKLNQAKLEEEKRQKEEQRKKDEERQKVLADLEKSLKEEQMIVAEQQMAQEAQSYIEIISQKVEQNWNRPPSARNGMLCELLIQLVPTGRVVAVSVVKSSGNQAFDRSAEQAVKKAEVFPELKKMSPQVFEKYYRRLNLIFNPQDLRQ